MNRPTLLLALAAGLLTPTSVGAQWGNPARARLQDLIEDLWRLERVENPLVATDAGDHRYNARLPSVAKEDEYRRAEMRRAFLKRLRAINRRRLAPDDQVTYDVFLRHLDDQIADFEFGAYVLRVNADYGFHMTFADLPGHVPLFTAQDYDNYIARLRAFRTYMDQNVALMRLGMERGFTVPRAALQGYEATITPHVVDDPEQSVFWAPFETFPVGVPERERAGLREAGRAAITDSVIPAYRTFLDFMTREYIPGARTTISASELPNGEAYYQLLVRRYTTLDLTPDSIHTIGVSEVERIRAEMDQVIREIGFEGDFAAFLRFLRTDPRFYAKTPDDLLREASWIAKRMDGKLPSLFRSLPRLPYGVEPVPAHAAPKSAAGRYIPASRGGKRAGSYWLNTHMLESRPLFALEALTLHEAVPGHHLQIALAQELRGLQALRSLGAAAAFIEGWGLYAERLGLEAGFYTDPYRNFGRLSSEMWRACRLVVDTGIHALGWTREHAMQYLEANTALSLHEIRTEVDRYVSWPGQALSYKLGELTIRELRREAEHALGARFDVRAFHDAVLRNGEVPLPVLEEQVRAWVRSGGP